MVVMCDLWRSLSSSLARYQFLALSHENNMCRNGFLEWKWPSRIPSVSVCVLYKQMYSLYRGYQRLGFLQLIVLLNPIRNGYYYVCYSAHIIIITRSSQHIIIKGALITFKNMFVHFRKSTRVHNNKSTAQTLAREILDIASSSSSFPLRQKQISIQCCCCCCVVLLWSVGGAMDGSHLLIYVYGSNQPQQSSLSLSMAANAVLLFLFGFLFQSCQKFFQCVQRERARRVMYGPLTHIPYSIYTHRPQYVYYTAIASPPKLVSYAFLGGMLSKVFPV